MQKKQQVIEKISEISRQRSKLDELYVTLQKTLSSYQSNTSRSLVQMRQIFHSLISQISIKILQRTKQIDSLQFRCEKLTREGENMFIQLKNIQSLQQYFNDLKSKLKNEKEKIEEFLTEKQRWEIKPDYHISEQNVSLLNSHHHAKQTNQIANKMLLDLRDDEATLINSKNRMSDVLKNINLAANITRMVRNRSKQDNKLIMLLTIGLFLQILLCLFVIKPMIRGS